MILVFLQNTIEACTPALSCNQSTEMSPSAPMSAAIKEIMQTGQLDKDFKLKMQAWGEFKQQIFEIYDNRIWFSPEINGGVNTTYMGLDEHLILYFTLLYKVRPLVEKRLIEFLASLKYFSETFQRAKQYAQLAGFWHNEEF